MSIHQNKVVVYSLDQEYYACPVIRILTPLRLANWDIIWATKPERSGFSFDLDIAKKANLIIIQRHFPANFTEKALRTLMHLKVPIIYDLDDAFLHVPQYHPLYHELKARAPYIKWILKEADLITVSTKSLKESIKDYTQRLILVQPNLLDWKLFDKQPRPRKKEQQFNFLISGTPTHQKDWSIIEEPLAEMINMYKGKINAIFFGELPKRFYGHTGVHLVNFQSHYKGYASQLKELDIHAALVPLEDTKFNRCKSNIKWLEYSAAGILGIFSEVTPYSTDIQNKETGLLAKNHAEAWVNAMEYVIKNPEETHRIIDNARREVSENFSVEALSSSYTAVFRDLIGQQHKHNIFSTLPVLPAFLQAYVRQNLDRHILWRFNRKHGNS